MKRLAQLSSWRKCPPPMSHASAPAVFLDRDGTLMEEAHYCSHPDQVKIIPGVPEALRALKQAGYRLVVVTNQSGIGRGYYTLDDYHIVAAHFLNLLGEDLIDAVYFCPEAPEKNSPRRKPQIGMITEAQRDLALDLSRSCSSATRRWTCSAGATRACGPSSFSPDTARRKTPPAQSLWRKTLPVRQHLF